MLGRFLSVITTSAVLVAGETDWLPGQVSTRICQWQQLRAAVLRDTVYLDGGNLWWQPGFADGSVREPRNDNNRLGIIYTLNFTTPFSTTQNISAILGTLYTGGGDTNNRAPNYEDGALLYNDHQFFLYGGLIQRSAASAKEPPGDEVLCYEKYQYGPERSFVESFIDKPLGENVTRYVAYGGAASAPSENLAWYFAGLRSATAGPIYTRGGATNETAAVHVSNYLIELDMAEQRHETFSNYSLPSHIQGRANPELVWVPVGRRGILVALGGVVYPDFVTITGNSSDPEANKAESPGFIQTIDIYDVDSRKWYQQKTTGGPGQLTRGCAVLARAQDSSSYNIYYYGGYDGLSQKTQPFSDDVWVLSLPSFTWVKLTSGNAEAEGRAGHKCVTPYPDQMFVIGGYPQPAGVVPSCLRETIRVYNLSTGQWLDRYDPSVWSPYVVPSAVVDKIGGSGTGGATATSPSPSWDSSEVASIFSQEYPTSKITTYYPYASASPTNNTNPSLPTDESSENSGIPAYLPPVLGTVLGLVFVTMVAVLIILYRRRRIFSSGTISEADTEYTAGGRIKAWLRGQPSEPKAPTVTTYDSTYSPIPPSQDPESLVSDPTHPSIPEMMNTEVPRPVKPVEPVELPDTSLQPRAELHSVPATSPAISHSTSVSNGGYFYPTAYHQYQQHSPSPNSNNTNNLQPPPIPQDESPIYYRPDSDALPRAPLSAAGASSIAATSPVTPSSAGGVSPGGAGIVPHPTTTPTPQQQQRVISGVSNLSERDRAHLRQISDTTVSSVTTGLGTQRGSYLPVGGGGLAGGGVGEEIAEGGQQQGGGHLGVNNHRPGQGSPALTTRRSVFSEDIDGAHHHQQQQ